MRVEYTHVVWCSFEFYTWKLLRAALKNTAHKHWRKRLGKRVGPLVLAEELSSALGDLARDGDYIKELADKLYDDFREAVAKGIPASVHAVHKWLKTVSWRVALREARGPLLNLLGPANDNGGQPEAHVELPEVDTRVLHRKLVTDTLVQEANPTAAQRRAYKLWRGTDLSDTEIADRLQVTLKAVRVRLSKARRTIAPIAARYYECDPQLFLVRRPKKPR